MVLKALVDFDLEFDLIVYSLIKQIEMFEKFSLNVRKIQISDDLKRFFNRIFIVTQVWL